jgi:hypothetical protein
MIKKAAKSAKSAVKKPAVKKAVKKPAKKATKQKSDKPVSFKKLIAQLDKDQGPLPSLYDVASSLDEVVNILTDIQHLFDSALDDCMNIGNDARAMALLHIAYGMLRGVIDKTEPLTSDLYRINRASLK